VGDRAVTDSTPTEVTKLSQVSVVKTIYDDLPPTAQELIDTLFRKWGAKDYRKELLQKAEHVRPREQKRATAIKSDLAEIWKACREDGEAPDTEEVTTLWKQLRTLKAEILKGQNAKNCGPKARKEYSQAFKIYEEDEQALIETIKGEPIKPTKRLDPAVLARIELKRKSNN